MIPGGSLYIHYRKFIYLCSGPIWDSLGSYTLFSTIGMILTNKVNACVGDEPSEQFIPKNEGQGEMYVQYVLMHCQGSEVVKTAMIFIGI